MGSNQSVQQTLKDIKENPLSSEIFKNSKLEKDVIEAFFWGELDSFPRKDFSREKIVELASKIMYLSEKLKKDPPFLLAKEISKKSPEEGVEILKQAGKEFGVKNNIIKGADIRNKKNIKRLCYYVCQAMYIALSQIRKQFKFAKVAKTGIFMKYGFTPQLTYMACTGTNTSVKGIVKGSFCIYFMYNFYRVNEDLFNFFEKYRKEGYVDIYNIAVQEELIEIIQSRLYSDFKGIEELKIVKNMGLNYYDTYVWSCKIVKNLTEKGLYGIEKMTELLDYIKEKIEKLNFLIEYGWEKFGKPFQEAVKKAKEYVKNQFSYLANSMLYYFKGAVEYGKSLGINEEKQIDTETKLISN
jgi:hypothetical protein